MKSARTHLLHRLQRGIDLYLPAILMGILALFTWQLLRSNTPTANPTAPTADKQMQYSMEQFSTARYAPDGRLETLLAGEKIEQWSSGESTIYGARLDHHPAAAASALSTARASTTTITPPTNNAHPLQARAARAQRNATGSNIELHGAASIYIQNLNPDAAPLTIQGEHLHILGNGARLQAEQSVRIHWGQQTIQAGTLDYQRDAGLLHLAGGVRGKWSPP